MIMDSEEIEALQAENEKLRRQRADLTRLHNQNHPNKTSFIFELLQNADDALGQIDAKNSEVKLTLQEDKFIISHYGKPFDQDDVDSICDACRSTKSNDENTIGKFGIGFKLVGVFTNSPQIFSGDKSFEIKDLYEYFPIKPLADLAKGETRIILPFENPDDAFTTIKDGLNKLRARDILFLRHIKALEWQVEGDVFRITQEEKQEGMARWVTITEHDGTKERWLIFSQGEDTKTRVEIAFLLKFNPNAEAWNFAPYEGGKTLYCYLPLASQQTDLKFLVQGAFKTIPSRAELAEDDHNNTLIERASELLIEILFWFKKHEILNWHISDWGIFDFLPIENVFFDSEHLFSPMAEKIRDALYAEKLLPTNRGFITAEHAIFSNDDQLRKIFNNKKICEIFGDKTLRWLKTVSSEKVENFLSRHLGIRTLSIYDIMDEEYITEAFMEDQKDKWIEKLYTLLNEIDEFNCDFDFDFDFDILKKLPLIRLTDKTIISSHDEDDELQVYLSSTKHSAIIKSETIQKKSAEEFIKKLGIGSYDDIDGFIDEMRGRYNQSNAPDISEKQYKKDIKRIIAFQKNDEIGENKKRALCVIRFVKAKNMMTGKTIWAYPDTVYASENFKALFSGVEVYLVDDGLMEKDTMAMLIYYGARERLQKPDGVYQCHLPEAEQKKRLRERGDDASDIKPSQSISNKNHDIQYLDDILASFGATPKKKRKNKAKALWEALGQMEPNISEYAEAKTFYTYDRFIKHNAKFIDSLNDAEWIPAPDGTLKKPEDVVFDSLGWDDNKLLREHIIFKPSDLDEKRRAVGLSEDGHKKGKTYQEIVEKKNNGLPLTAAEENLLEANEAVEEERSKNSQPSPEEIPLEETDAPPEESQDALVEDYVLDEDVEISVIDHRPDLPDDTPTLRDRSASQPNIYTTGTTSPPSPSPDSSDKMNQDDVVARTHVEKAAIAVVLRKYPNWKDANIDHPNNPGYDLYELDEDNNQCRWIEVKGLALGLTGKPKMSNTQRGFALGLKAAGKGDQYTHITVEYAHTKTPQIIRYDNPTAEPHRLVGDDDD